MRKIPIVSRFVSHKIRSNQHASTATSTNNAKIVSSLSALQTRCRVQRRSASPFDRVKAINQPSFHPHYVTPPPSPATYNRAIVMPNPNCSSLSRMAVFTFSIFTAGS